MAMVTANLTTTEGRPFPWNFMFCPEPWLDDASIDKEAKVRLSQLCPVCEGFGTWMREYLSSTAGEENCNEFMHHSSGRELEKSAREGCHLCTLIWYTCVSNMFRCRSDMSGTVHDILLSFQQLFLEVHGKKKCTIFPTDHNILPTTRGGEASLVRAARFEMFEGYTFSDPSIYTYSETLWNLAANWINDCVNSHEACQNNQQEKPFSPSRLIEILEQPHGEELRLIDASQYPANPKYVALSYCWGADGSTLHLHSSTEKLMRSGFSPRCLSKTIRHAIGVVKKLSLRYMWVDSLCILQDSNSDWLKEAEQMGDVYYNSFLVIAALGATSSDQGLFSRRDPLAYSPCHILQDHDGKDLWVKQYPEDIDLGSNWFRNSPLYTRGWVLQERLLAPRTLNFGVGLVWECREKCLYDFHYNDPIQVVPIPNGKALVHLDSPLFTNGSNSNIEKLDARIFRSWIKNILVPYSRSKLTVPTDRLIAVSGIIKRFSQKTGWDNVYGLWKPFMLDQLLWQSLALRLHYPFKLKPRIPGIPSWSWASIESPVLYLWHHLEAVPIAVITEILANTMSFSSRNQEAAPAPTIIIESALLRAEILLHGIVGKDYEVIVPEWTGSLSIMTEFSPDTNPLLYGPYFYVPLLERKFNLRESEESHVFGLLVTESRSVAGAYQRAGLLELTLEEYMPSIATICERRSGILLV